MSVIQHVRLNSGRSFEIQASIHRYVKGRKGADRHGLLVTARESSEQDPSLELLVDLSYLFEEAEIERLLGLRSDGARDREIASLLAQDASAGLTFTPPGSAEPGPLLSAGVLEAERPFLDAFGPCRLWCVPGQNTIKLRVLDSANKELFVCSLPPGFVRMPGQQQQPMWWGEVTLNPFDIAWEKVQAPSVMETLLATLEALTGPDTERERAEEDLSWVSRCGDLVTRCLGQLAWSESTPRGEDCHHRRLIRALAPTGDRFGLEISQPTLVTYQLNLPVPQDRGVMDPQRVERRVQRAMNDLSGGLFVRGGNKKARAEGDARGKHSRGHSTYFARHPSEMLRRILNLAYTRTDGFDVTPALASQEVEVSLYELKEYAMAVATKLKLNWTAEVSQCAKDAIVEAVSKFSGSWEGPSEGRSGGVIAHIKATVKRRLKDLANPRVHRSLPGGAMAPVITTTLKILGVPLDQAVPRGTTVPDRRLWDELERAVEADPDEEVRGTNLVKLAAATVARGVTLEASASAVEAIQTLEQEVPGEDKLEEWMDRRTRAEQAVLDLQTRYLAPNPGVDDITWQRRCLFQWYLDLTEETQDAVRSRLRMSYLSLVLLKEIRGAFKRAAAGTDEEAAPAIEELERAPHRFPAWFANWLVEGQRRVGEKLPSNDKVDKKLFPLKLFLERPTGDIQLERFPVRALKHMAFPANIFLSMILRGESYREGAAVCCGMDVQRLIRAANSNKIEMDDHWHEVLVQYIQNDPCLYNRQVPLLYDDLRPVEELCEVLTRRSLELGCLRRGHPFGTEHQAPHSPELVNRMVELAGETAETRRAEHFWRFADLDMQSEERVAEAVTAVPWEELRKVLGKEVCRIMDTTLADGSPRTFRDLTATEIFLLSHKLGRKNCWKEDQTGAGQ